MSLAVSVPGSSANLGPGFDVLGMAVGLHVRMGVGDGGEGLSTNHPAHEAFSSAGGVGDVWFESHLPSGRGLGFSGAAIVAGTILGLAVRDNVSADDLNRFIEMNRGEILARSTAIEGHADNVAASLHGGVVAVSDGRVVSVPVGMDARLLFWIPRSTTSTAKSRSRLDAMVDRHDAVFNIGRTVLLIEGLRTGDAELIALGTQDRLHQDVRLEAVPRSRDVRDVLVAQGAIASWLSGSGPTVAALCASDHVERIRSRSMELIGGDDGRMVEVAIDEIGARQAT